MSLLQAVEVTAVIAAILAFIQIAITMRVGLMRMSSKISLGDGGNKELTKRIRGHANFIENVPMALMLILLNELSGLDDNWLYALGGGLILFRVLHYISIVFNVHGLVRPIGMTGTLLTMLVSAILLLV